MTRLHGSMLVSLLLASTPSDGADLTQLKWQRINDTVMGGRSSSAIGIAQDKGITFSGQLSLANNGGFASIRAPYSIPSSDPVALRLTVLGDGKEYQLRLRVNGYLDGPAFVYSFQTTANQPQTMMIRESDFVLQFRGRVLSSPYQLSFADVRSIGFLISAKQAGGFALLVDSLAAVPIT